MNTLKKILSSLFVLCLLLGVTACKEEVKYDPAGPAGTAEVYFPSTLPATVELSQDMSVTSYDIQLYRVDKTNALMVNLAVENESPDIFNIPTTASFAAGSETTNITITYDPEKLGYDTYKSISISVTDETSPYGISVYQFKAFIPAPWKSLGMATYTDDFVSSFYGVSQVPYQVEIQENLVTPGVFRLVNPYGAAYPYNDPGDWDDSKDHYLEINASDPEGVYIPYPQYSGMDWGYGEFIMSSLAGLYIYRGTSTLEEEKAAGHCGTFIDGVITFPINSLVVGMANYPASNPGAMYSANGHGWFQVVMPGVVLADYSSSVEYSGRYTDANNNMFAVANVTLGADVAYAKVAIVPGNLTDDALNGIIDGSIESVQITAGGTVNLPCSSAGKYTFVVVTFDANEETQDYSSVSFSFTTGDAAVMYPIEDFYGDYVMTGLSVFDDSEMDPMDVTIAAGADPNTLVITGIDYCASVKATFPIKGYMSIVPQQLANYGKYDMTWYSVTPDWDITDTDALIFTRLESGDIVMSPDSYAMGYILNSDAAGGYVDGYYNISFTPASSSKAAALKAASAHKAPTFSSMLNVKSKGVGKHLKNSDGKSMAKKGSIMKALRNLTKPAPLF